MKINKKAIFSISASLVSILVGLILGLILLFVFDSYYETYRRNCYWWFSNIERKIAQQDFL